LHHPLTGLPVPALAQVRFQHRRGRLLYLEEERIVRVASLEQDDVCPGSDAADADDLAGHVHHLEALEQLAPVILQGRPVGTELFVECWHDLGPGTARKWRQGRVPGR
jgi:hypothetical protein